MDAQFAVPAIGGGMPMGQPAGGPIKLFELRGANLNSTADQVFTKIGTFTKYKVTQVEAIGKTGNALIAAGGIYSAAAKAGSVIVSAAQAWAALSAPDKLLPLVTIVLSDVLQTVPNLSLTTAAGAAATADIFAYGVILD